VLHFLFELASDTSKSTAERMQFLNSAKDAQTLIKQFIATNSIILGQENLALYCLQDIYNINTTHSTPLFITLEQILVLPCWGLTGHNDLLSTYNEEFRRARNQSNEDYRHLLDKGLKICDTPGIYEIHKGNLYYNLGLSCSQIEHEQALKYFSESEKYSPGDIDPILQKCRILTNFRRKAEYEGECIKIKDPTLKLMLEILYIYRNQEAFENLLKDKEKEFLWNEIKKNPTLLEYTYNIIHREAYYKKDKDTIIESCINGIKENPSHSVYLSSAILTLHELNDFDSAFLLLREVQKRHPDIYTNRENDIILKYAEFIIYESLNDFELSTPKLQYINERYAQCKDNKLLQILHEHANLKKLYMQLIERI